MSGSTLRISALALLIGLVLLPETASTQKRKRESVSPVTVVDAEMFERSGDLNLLIGTPGLTFDSVAFSLPKKALDSIEVIRGPQGWTCGAVGGRYRCTGEGIGRGRFRLRGGTGLDWGSKIEVGIFSGERRIDQRKVDVGSRDATSSDSWSGRLDPPRRFAAGETIWARPLGAETGGSWSLNIDRKAFEALPPTDRSYTDLINLKPEVRQDWTDGRSDPPVAIRLPADLGAGSDLRWIHHDGWGYKDVDAPFDDWQYESAPRTDCQPVLAACQDRVAKGGSICVCGCFPSGAEWAALELDGKPIGFPSGMSSFTMRIPLPDDVQPGEHTLGWASGAGGIGSLPFEVVRVGGSIEQAHLHVGQSTPVKFWIDGTRATLPMDIELTQGNAEIQGGNRQRTWTDGGQPNAIDRMLHAQGVGDFNIIFDLQLEECPCEAAEIDDTVPPMATHRFEPIGTVNGRLGSLGVDLPIRFKSRSVIAETPTPPLDLSLPLDFDVRQLGLRAQIEGLPEMVFEARADERSWGSLRDLEVDGDGGFKAGTLDLDLSAQFSMEKPAEIPYGVLEVGGGFKVDLDQLDLSLGSDFVDAPFRLTPGSDAAGSVDFSNIQLDAAGTRYFGDARFRMSNWRVQF